MVVVRFVLLNVPILAEVICADKVSKSSLTDVCVNRFSIEVNEFNPVNIPLLRVAVLSVKTLATIVSSTVKESDNEALTPIKLPSMVIAPIPVISPVVEISQSLELRYIVSPPSPNITAPPGVKVNAPVVVKVVDAPSKRISVSAIDTSPLASNAPFNVVVPDTDNVPILAEVICADKVSKSSDIEA